MSVNYEYALKASFCLAIIFLFYTLLLKRMTYYIWNRYFLLLFSILSFIVPFVNINVFLQAQEENTSSFINQIPSIAAHRIIGNSANAADELYWQILSAVYFIVSAILFLRLLIQLLSIRKIRSKATLIVDGEVKLYQLTEPILPFSFFNSIFINKDNYSENELQEIIEHERVHVQQKHTLDVLVTEIICILNWYNPFAWLIKNAVRENLEFLADDVVIKKGVNRKNYQYLLLKVTGDIPSSIASSFKLSSLKTRILMMNKTKTSRFHLLKFALLVPVIVFILLAFGNKKDIKNNASEVKSVSAGTFTLSALTYSIPDTKVKAIVFKEQDKSLLKPGELFNLTMVSNEKNRLKNLLERNGYNKLKSNAITFLIDSSSANKSFSVQVNINVGAIAVSEVRKGLIPFNGKILSSDHNNSLPANVTAKVNLTGLGVLNIRPERLFIHLHLKNSKATFSI